MRLLTDRISRSRRSRFAGPVVVLLALVVTGGVVALLGPAQAADETTASTDDVAKGRALFLVSCATCHGQNGEGVTTVGGQQYGPPLAGVGAAAVDFQVGTGRMPMAQPGVQAPRKPVVFNDEQISQLAAFVASLAPGPSIPGEDVYDPAAIPDEDLEEAIVQGGEFFRTNCTACHNFAGSGGALSRGKYAPHLTGVPAKYIYEALLTGPQQMPVFSDANLSPEQKREVIAYLERIGNTDETPRYGGFNLGSVGPVSEGMFAWLVGVGGCVAFGIWIANHGARSTRKKEAKS